MWIVRWFFLLAILIILTIFSISNAGFTTDIRIIPRLLEFYDISVIWIVSISFILGLIISFIVAIFKFFKMNMEIMNRDKKIGKLQEELASLRNLPLTDTDPAAPAEPEEDE